MSSPDLICFPLMARLLVVVRDLNFVGIARLPPTTQTILIVDPDAPLPATPAAQSFKTIPLGEWRVRRDPSRDSPDPASSEPPAINPAGRFVEPRPCRRHQKCPQYLGPGKTVSRVTL